MHRLIVHRVLMRMDQQTNRATSIQIRFASSAASGHPHDGREPYLAGNDPSVTGHFLSALTDQIRFWESDQRNAPCRRRAFPCRLHRAISSRKSGSRISVPYRSINSTFGIGPSVRISHRTAEPCHRVFKQLKRAIGLAHNMASHARLANRRTARLPALACGFW